MNVGADLARLVPGRVSTEVDARLAYDTAGIVKKVTLDFKLLKESLCSIHEVIESLSQLRHSVNRNIQWLLIGAPPAKIV